MSSPHSRAGAPRWAGAAIAVLVLVTGVLVPPPAARAASDALGLVSLAGSPFSPNGDSSRETLRLTATLARAARLTLSVGDFDGRIVRTLARAVSYPAGRYGWTWNGRDDAARLVPDGTYTFRLEAVDSSGAAAVAERTATKAAFVVYAPRPGAITVVINPGHGKPDPGAYYGGYREADFNLDISLRLRAMLQGAGVHVVMTRTTDAEVNGGHVDVTSDGVVGQRDELAMRNDIANRARADVLVTVMNNAYGCQCVRGTETYTNGDRGWTPQGTRLAQLIQSEHLSQLAQYRSTAWYPIDRGVRLYDFYVMRPYDPGIIPRPALMPSVLTESLFMDHPNELAVLANPRVRESLAVAYYNGLARYLNERPLGLRYSLIAAPRSVTSDQASARFAYSLTNRGVAAARDWILELRYVPAVPLYDGSAEPGTLLASAPVPDGLAAGVTTTLTLDGVPAPPPGEWLVKADVRLPDGTSLSEHGVVPLQVPLSVTSSETPAPTDSAPPSDPATLPSSGGAARGLTHEDGDGSGPLTRRYITRWFPPTEDGPGGWRGVLDFPPDHDE